MSIKLKTKRNFFLILVIFFLLIAIAVNPSAYITSCFDGLLVWATVVLPALLSFIFFTKTLTALGIDKIIGEKFKLFPKIFKVPAVGMYVFVMSILSGYPVGAKIVADLYEAGSLTKAEAYRLTTFTSNSGPMFILGSVGIGMLHSRKLGLIILFAHILGALTNGLVHRNHKEQNINFKKTIQKQNTISIGDLMWNTVQSVLIIGGFIALFFVIIEVFNTLHIFSSVSGALEKLTKIPAGIFSAIFGGLLEITHGCLDIAALGLSDFSSGMLACGIISFGGFATILQALVFLKKFDMRMSFFIKQKITHTIFSLLWCAPLLLIF